MLQEEIEFVELYSFQKKNYKEIEQIMKISRKELINLRTNEVDNLIKHIQYIYNKFTGERRKSFNKFKEFYEWYEKQEQKCGYCGITQDNLYKLFSKDNRILPILDNKRVYEKVAKRSSGTLEIERLDSSIDYDSKNIILACPLCNNAKSNLIDEKNWKEIFVPAMKEYYNKLLKI
jgi:hypothetical protein